MTVRGYAFTTGDRSRGALRLAVLLAAGLPTVGCLAPSSPKPASAPPQASPAPPESVVDACKPSSAGPPRLILRRGYLEHPVFRPLEANIALDGRTIFSSMDEDRLRTELEVVVDVPATPGRHELTSLHRLRGHGLGTDAYLNRYRFNVLSKYSFEVHATGGTCVTLVLFSRRDDGLPLEERPSVRHQITWGGK